VAADVPSRFVRQPTDTERSQLIELRDAGPAASRPRAAVVLLSAARTAIPEIVKHLGLSRPTVTDWLRRFDRSGVSGLLDRPRSGRPSRISTDVLRHIAMVVSARPRDLGVPGTRWSLARLRQYLVQAGVVPALSLESLRIGMKRAGLSFTSRRAGQIQKGVTTMIPGAFEYHTPTSLGEATALLARLGDDAKVLSGGQSLIPLMKLRLATPRHLVDINGLPGLAYVREDGGALRIGGLTREADLEESPVVRSRYPLLFDTCKVIADPIVRNLATVGGNLAHGDPANDHPATMLAFGAEVVAMGTGGERKIPIGSFFTGPFATALKADEIVVEIRVPSPKPGSGGAYVKMERKVGDFATAAVAVQLTLGAGGVCEQVGIGLTNVGSVPIKAERAEAALRGKRPDEATIKQAAQLAADAAQPAADLRGSVEYKKDLVRVLTGRALRKAIERAQRGS
jgi:aerobic carbon-monoxide dehydrogenase medium subunit